MGDTDQNEEWKECRNLIKKTRHHIENLSYILQQRNIYLSFVILFNNLLLQRLNRFGIQKRKLKWLKIRDMEMMPNFPLYIVSKGRYDTRLTSRALEEMRVPYFIVIEEQEYKQYSEVINPKKILILDKRYQDEYDTFDNLESTKSKGPGAARNFAWDHSISTGHKWHWVMDDNIRQFSRFNKNLIIKLINGTGFRCMEDFCLRYKNIGMAGPNYEMFVSRKEKLPPFVINTRIYSCNLIKNSIPFRWRGRYNEDTDISLRLLKSGFCTVQV